MADREKLIELLDGVLTTEDVTASEKVADHPIAHGVTVRERGRWVSSGCGFDVCSECRKVYSSGYLTAMGIKPRMQFNFCPNCGADMRPKGEGEEDG